LWLEPVPGGFLLIQQELGSGHMRYWFHVRAYDATGHALGETLVVHASRQAYRHMDMARDERGLYVLHPWPTVLERYSIAGDGSVTHEVLREFERADPLAVASDGRRVVAVVHPRGVGSTAGTLPPLLWIDGTEVEVSEPARACLGFEDVLLDGESLVFIRAVARSNEVTLCRVSLEGELEGAAIVTDAATPIPERLRDRVFAELEYGYSSEYVRRTDLAIRTITYRSWPLTHHIITTDDFLDFAFTWNGARFITLWTHSTPRGWQISSVSLTCEGG
jgi:hypothetical protein